MNPRKAFRIILLNTNSGVSRQIALELELASRVLLCMHSKLLVSRFMAWRPTVILVQ